MQTKTPTQVEHPWRASFRTFVQSVIPITGLLLLAIPEIIEIIIEETGTHGITISPGLYAILTGIGVGTAAIAAIIARIGAIPGVEGLLEQYLPGLSAQPIQEQGEHSVDAEDTRNIYYEGQSGFTLRAKE